MKILSFKIDYGRPIVTGDSSKNTLVETDKFFSLDSPSVIDLSTDALRQQFLKQFLQNNHDYLLHNDVLIIDGISYNFAKETIRSIVTNRDFIIPTWEKRNLFNIYVDFYRFHQTTNQLRNVKEFINGILAEKDMRKHVSEIDETIKGQIITVTDTSYGSSLTWDFQLMLDTNNKLSFLHFFEPEGEYYSSGSPISRNRLQENVNKAIHRLNLHDEFVMFFNRTMKLTF
jgi:hypothetical protein